jgi:hypothetical protein
MILTGNPPRRVGDDQLLVKDGFVAHLFDLKTSELKSLVRYEAQYSGNFQPIMLLGDKVWMGFPFSSIDVKTRKIENFPSLRPSSREKLIQPFQPGVFFEKVGEREYLLGDPAALWLLKMKVPAPAAE